MVGWQLFDERALARVVGAQEHQNIEVRVPGRDRANAGATLPDVIDRPLAEVVDEPGALGNRVEVERRIADGVDSAPDDRRHRERPARPWVVSGPGR